MAWGKLLPGEDGKRANTYAGHEWRIVRGPDDEGQVVAIFTIKESSESKDGTYNVETKDPQVFAQLVISDSGKTHEYILSNNT